MMVGKLASGLVVQIAPMPVDATLSIQSAIDRVSDAGGGRVALLPGRHACRGVTLRSGVELHLSDGVVLCPSSSYEDYEGNIVSVIAENSNRAMIVARNAQKISLTGTGLIEAGGRHFILGEDDTVGTHLPAKHRPRVLVFEHCSDVVISDIRIHDSPMWTIHLVHCDGVAVQRVTVRSNEKLPNTDGLVLDACEKVRVEDCDISTADDGICLKTSKNSAGTSVGTCNDILVRRCIVRSQSCALKIGTETFGDISDVVFEECKISRSNRGMGIFSRDGGNISNVRFSRIELECTETRDGFWGSGEALTVTVVDRDASSPAGSVTGLSVQDITGSMEGAITLVSTAVSSISAVKLSRILLHQNQGSLGTSDRFDLRPTSADVSPDPSLAGRANAWTRGADGVVVGLYPYPGGKPGIYMRGTDDVELVNVQIARPSALPQNWNDQAIVIDKMGEDTWRR